MIEELCLRFLDVNVNMAQLLSVMTATGWKASTVVVVMVVVVERKKRLNIDENMSDFKAIILSIEEIIFDIKSYAMSLEGWTTFQFIEIGAFGNIPSMWGGTKDSMYCDWLL